MEIDLKRYEFKKTNLPKHELAASVQEIIDLIGETKQYNFKYWLRKVKLSKISYTGILGILKEANNLPDKYSKGGFITNQLKWEKKNIIK